MQTLIRLNIVMVTLAVWILVASTSRIWGQPVDRIGTVLLVEGTAEVKPLDIVAWKPLQFRDTVFWNDTVRTEARSRLKLLLLNDSIWTLDERGKMHFAEVEKSRCQPRGTIAPRPPQPLLKVLLLLGKLRGVISPALGAHGVAETATPNAVMCMYGTSFIMSFTPPDTSEFVSLEGLITVQNLFRPELEIEPVWPNFRTIVVQHAAPISAVKVASAEVQSLNQGLNVIEQVPELDSVRIPDTGVALVVEAPVERPPNTAIVMPPETFTPDTSPMIRNAILNLIVEFSR